MPNNKENPFIGLKSVFHEPSRLSIVSALCGAIDGLSFNELKEECELTDGNLSRHLKTLEEAGVVIINKMYSGSKSRTVIRISDMGRDGFMEYLKTLEEVLIKAARALSDEEEKAALSFNGLKPAGA